MTYITPNSYICEAGHVHVWTPSSTYEFWPRTIEEHPKPVCITCWNTFLIQNKLLMKPGRTETKPESK